MLASGIAASAVVAPSTAASSAVADSTGELPAVDLPGITPPPTTSHPGGQLPTLPTSSQADLPHPRTLTMLTFSPLPRGTAAPATSAGAVATVDQAEPPRPPPASTLPLQPPLLTAPSCHAEVLSMAASVLPPPPSAHATVTSGASRSATPPAAPPPPPPPSAPFLPPSTSCQVPYRLVDLLSS